MSGENISQNTDISPIVQSRMIGSELPTQLWHLIDLEFWYKPANTQSSVEHLLTRIARATVGYNNYDDGDTLQAFQDDFQGWNIEMFEKLPSEARKYFRDFIRAKGVYTGPKRGKISQQLQKLFEFDPDNLPEWDDNLLKEIYISNTKSLAYKRQQLLLYQDSQLGQETSQQQAQQSIPYNQSQTKRSSQSASEYIKNIKLSEHPSASLKTNQPPTKPLLTSTQTYNNTTIIPLFDPNYDPYSTLPPMDIPNQRLHPENLNQFIKMYDKSSKYTGEPYDLLDDKMKIFLNICFHADIVPEQFHAVLPRILTGRAEYFYLHFINRNDTFAVAYNKLKRHFDTEVNHSHYYTDWTTTTFNRTRIENPDKKLHETLQITLDKLQLCQRALGNDYSGEKALRTAVINACRSAPELEMALFKPALDCESLFSDLRSSIETYVNREVSNKFFTRADSKNDQFYTDRRYHLNEKDSFQGRTFKHHSTNNRNLPRTNNRRQWRKRCFVCNREGCWSTKHPQEERRKAKSQFVTTCEFTGEDPNSFSIYLAEYEGHDLDQVVCFNNHPDDDDDDVNNISTTQYLMNQAFLYRITGEDIFNAAPTISSEQFRFPDRYSNLMFQGILPDTGAAQVSTAGHEQVSALKQEDPSLQIDTTTAGKAIVRFGKGNSITSIGTIKLKTPIGTIVFHVLDTPTPFLLCLADMDRLNVYYDNTTDQLINKNTQIAVPVIRKWGHPWFFLNRNETASVFLTETELRRLHRRFGHLATDRLYNLLIKTGHEDVDKSVIKEIEKFCHNCQMNRQSPHRFKFTLHEDHEFNYEIMVDIMYLSNRPVLHVIDVATAFQAGRFLSSISAKETREALRFLWIDTYQGPPDIITHDAGTNFASTEFRLEAKMFGITCKQIPIEAHWSIGKLERYHAPLRRAYEIINSELNAITSQDAILQMALKAVNDTAGPNGLVPTLLVFGSYPRINNESPPSPSTIKRADAIQKAMKALRRVQAERQINDAINTRNGPSIHEIFSLPLQSEVCVWREKNGWQGPLKVIATDGYNVTVDMLNGPATFRSTVVKPYYREINTTIESPPPNNDEDDSVSLSPTPCPPVVKPRLRGRPLGSKNKPKDTNDMFITKKEKSAVELSNKLRVEGIILAPGGPFEESDTREIDDLIGRGVFQFERYNSVEHAGYRLFNSRMVREVKGINYKPYEKSRLVIQGHNDNEKETILTQSPTIQRVSQRLILALAPTLCLKNFSINIRDITQAYPQSQSKLNRTILSTLPVELRQKYPEHTIIRVIKPLYGIAEAGVHWFSTYQKHHLDKLNMNTSTYDPCLLISTDCNTFGIVGLQTDDTIMLTTPAFSEKEDDELQKAQFRAKPKTVLTPDISLEFNGVKLMLNNKHIFVHQKAQGKRLEIIDAAKPDYAQGYAEQRARGAYLASICQPEASFDLSVAAQIQHPDSDACKKLNNRIKWQIENIQRGLRYIPLKLETAKLFIFADGSFANNKDLSSQLGYVIILANEIPKDETFTLQGNLLHWSSTKCKRVTRSVLASEVYGVVNGFDIGFCIATTLKMITNQLGISSIPLVLCTDSYSLYECLVKLGTTKEKRLMIDIMALRESYERREITEIRWVNGDDNPADAMTKSSPNSALRQFIDTNELSIRVKGKVDRSNSKVEE